MRQDRQRSRTSQGSLRKPREISLRAYVPLPQTGQFSRARQPDQGPSEYSLILDTETKTDPSQSLRFGVYQVRRAGELFCSGIFHDLQFLNSLEISLLKSYAASHKMDFMDIREFVEKIFFGIGYDLRATIIGFNLPFDLSRLAIRHGSARSKIMRGGFTFTLSDNKFRPRLQIKQLNPRASLIQFTTRPGRFDTRGMRKRKQMAIPRRGYFVDVKTQAAALLAQSFSLASLAKYLGTEHQKARTEDHGAELSEAYIGYGVRDVQVTWECYCLLRAKFEQYNFEYTLQHQVLSEAGIGKALLKEIGVQPWQAVQPDFPQWLTGVIMSTYYGGRSEVHWRRDIARVTYCDFLSMYPTVCTLMGLWDFASATGMDWRDATKEVADLLNNLTFDDLRRPETWRLLSVIVQVKPDNDLFPVRADYDGHGQETIGLNYLKSKTPLWYTLADCIGSKLLTGKAPKIIKAIRFESKEIQNSLKSICLAGNPEYSIDPYKDDLFKRIIDLRLDTKKRLKEVAGAEKGKLENEQLQLKITANSISYGIFVELNVVDLTGRQERQCHGFGKPFSISADKIEEPGKYFHPLLATLITGAARLMLAISETLARQYSLDWAFCDTDSIAFVKTDGIDATFNSRVELIRNWFQPLNPYLTDEPLLKLENANWLLENGKIVGQIAPLRFLGISSKRYVLFNIGPDGKITIRKASAHGLGHLKAPYPETDAPSSIPAPEIPLNQIGVERWQYDLWHQIIRAAFDDHPDQVPLDYHPALAKPAASRYAATTPILLNWFKTYNRNRLYTDQVRSFNFLMAFQARSPELQKGGLEKHNNGIRLRRPAALKPIAPFDADPLQAAKNCFDRETGKSVSIKSLKSYREALAQYHLRPEAKFLNGNHVDRGKTVRRRIEVDTVRNIGKEANRWEDQFYTGANSDAQIDYGIGPDGHARLTKLLRKAAALLSERKLASHLGISRQTISKLLQSQSAQVPSKIVGLIEEKIPQLLAELQSDETNNSALIKMAEAEIAQFGLSEFARRIDMDASNLAKVVSGKRKASSRDLQRIGDYFYNI